MARKNQPAQLSPCERPEIDARYYEYAGFKKGFTKHDYCAKHHLGVEVGSLYMLVKCGCPCHAKKDQADRA